MESERFDARPEFGMGLHVATPRRRSQVRSEREDVFVVFNGSVGVTIEDIQAATSPLPITFVDREEPSLSFTSLPSRDARDELGGWRLMEEELDLDVCDDVEILARLVNSPAWSLERLRHHGRLHGSPPFSGQTRAGQCYVRFSRFLADRRVTPRGGLLPGTFVTSQLDADTVSTALTAVGHYALPSIAPPLYRFTIVPPPLTDMYYGTVSPAFGQSGGGTEIEFHRGVPDGAVSGPSMLPYL